MPYKDSEKYRESQRVHSHNWYIKNKDKQIEANKRQREKIAKWFQEYKADVGCATCSEKHPACLEFHHRDPKKKEHTVANMARSGRSIENILLEIEKCDVLCANCHRKLHWEERQSPVVLD